MNRLLPAVLIMVTASSPALSQCSDATKKELEAFDHAWGHATESGDRAAMATFVADEYEGHAPAGAQGKSASIDAAVRAAEQNRADPANALKLSYDYYMISCTPNTATITHRTTVTTKVDGADRTFYNRSVHFLEKRNGRWQVVANAGHSLDDAGVLAYLEREWNDAGVKHDAAWIERNYASDATEVASRTGQLHNKAEAIAATRADKSVLTLAELSDLNTRIEGSTAVVTGINHYVGRNPDGSAMDRRVRFLDVFVKRDGRWQVLATQATSIP